MVSETDGASTGVSTDELLRMIWNFHGAMRLWDEDNDLSDAYVGMTLRAALGQATDALRAIYEGRGGLLPLPLADGVRITGSPCGCGACVADRAEALREAGAPFSEVLSVTSVFIVCPNCGDKRCPRAGSHKKKCQREKE